MATRIEPAILPPTSRAGAGSQSSPSRFGSAEPRRDTTMVASGRKMRAEVLTNPTMMDRFMGWVSGMLGLNRKRVELADGLWLDETRRTAEGAPVRVLTIDPARIRVEAGFYDGKTGMPTSAIRQIPGVLAAVNATFFGMNAGEATYGDLVGLGKAALDEDNPNRGYDQISDRRWALATLRDGSIRFVKGGLTESGLPRDQVRGFVGGIGQLYGPGDSARLEQDVRDGTFRDRLDQGVANRSFPNIDLESTIARTFVGVDAQGRLILTTFGEGSIRAEGGSLAEGALMMKKLGAVEAYALDGGGSSHMIVPGKVNTLTDGRLVKSYLIVRSAA